MDYQQSGGLYRQVTAVATAGEMGQLFTVYEKNWHCEDCRQENYASRKRCSRCKKAKPVNLKDQFVKDAALEAMNGKQASDWQEVIDPNSRQIYYYNNKTGETQWDRPIELGAAPFATGWFGRGAQGSVSKTFAEKNALYLTRPARKQKDFIDPKKYHLEGANEYNIWYGHFIGDGPDNPRDREAASDRCVVDTDAGYTKADSGGTNRKERRFFCVHFAKGVCAKGADCNFFHRIPTPDDDAKCDEMLDCFGRQKHSAHRDDMNGVGSFMKPCRTLFVGNLNKSSYESPKALEDACWKHFGEWGELESINVIHRLSIAFPRYRLRTSAEFAKEAMSQQALDKNEILSIRWAHDDPNPVAQDSISRADRDALAALVKARGISLQTAPFEYPSSYQLPDAKRARIEGGDGDDLLASSELAHVAYPNTDVQYSSEPSKLAAAAAAAAAADIGSSSAAESEAESSLVVNNEYLNYFKSLASGSVVDTAPSASSATGAADSASAATTATVANTGDENAASVGFPSEPAAGEDIGSSWAEFVDDESGATYYYNSVTGESSWGPDPRA